MQCHLPVMRWAESSGSTRRSNRERVGSRVKATSRSTPLRVFLPFAQGFSSPLPPVTTTGTYNMLAAAFKRRPTSISKQSLRVFRNGSVIRRRDCVVGYLLKWSLPSAKLAGGAQRNAVECRRETGGGARCDGFRSGRVERRSRYR